MNEENQASKQEIGAFLKQLRKDKGITQDQLADDINFSRSVISRIETGEELPSYDKMQLFSSYYGVSITDLYAGKILTDEKKKEITPIVENVEESINNEYKVKRRNLIIKFIIAIIIIIFCFLLYYFLTSYKSVKIYKVYGQSDNFKTNDGILVIGKEKIYFSLYIIPNDDIEIYNITLKYKNNNNDSLIIKQDDNSLFISDSYGYDSFFNYEEIVNSKGKFYIEVESNIEIENIELEIPMLYENKKIIFSKVTKEVKDEDNNDINEIIPEKINNTFNKEGDLYTYNYELDDIEVSISYDGLTSDFNVVESGKKYSKNWIYNINYKTLDYTYIEDNKTIEQISIDIDSMSTEETTIYEEFKINYIEQYIN